ncbi:glycosyl transferase family 1 [Afifella sp. IM 167]|nr:glycosyl transferase family 1 [Afifella sp. IM 167]
MTEDWYFVSHRLPIARAARDAGMSVHVATRISAHGEALEREGFTVHPLRWRRRGDGPAGAVRAILEIRSLLGRIRPDILHAVSLKPVIFGGLASRIGHRAARVFAITGLGFGFTDRSWKSELVRLAMRAVFLVAIDRKDAVVLLQNEDDRRVLVEKRFLKRAKTAIIRGSGVDGAKFAPLPLPADETVTIGFVARMIAIKGVEDLVRASEILVSRGVPHRLLLAGGPDPDNRSSISPQRLAEWAKRPQIKWLGNCADVRTVWRRADIAALPSLGGEGLPKSLLEAAACRRPIVATDVAGNRDIAVEGASGCLVPPADPAALADALERLISDRPLRERLGEGARLLIEEHFEQGRIVEQTMALYGSLLPGASPRGPSA